MGEGEGVWVGVELGLTGAELDMGLRAGRGEWDGEGAAGTREWECE